MGIFIFLNSVVRQSDSLTCSVSSKARHMVQESVEIGLCMIVDPQIGVSDLFLLLLLTAGEFLQLLFVCSSSPHIR